nr:hypothetical protein Iba_scaffold35171CG0020 [Ipomoea batatas]
MAENLVGDGGCLSNHKECAKINGDRYQAGQNNKNLQNLRSVLEGEYILLSQKLIQKRTREEQSHCLVRTRLIQQLCRRNLKLLLNGICHNLSNTGCKHCQQ